MSVTLDHVVVRVPDLARAIADFGELGFTVTAGGKHPAWGSENALIGFADQTYLELIAFPPPDHALTRERYMQRLAADGADAVQQRVGSWAAVACGLVDYAVRPVQIGEELARLRAAGVAMRGPFSGSRERPDGQRIAWEMAIPPELVLPFMCADVTPLERRIPGGDRARHANGSKGITEVVMVCDSVPSASNRLHALFAGVRAVAVPGGVRYVFANWSLRMLEAVAKEQLQHLAERGASPWQLRLNAPPSIESHALAEYGLYLIAE